MIKGWGGNLQILQAVYSQSLPTEPFLLMILISRVHRLRTPGIQCSIIVLFHVKEYLNSPDLQMCKCQWKIWNERLGCFQTLAVKIILMYQHVYAVISWILSFHVF